MNPEYPAAETISHLPTHAENVAPRLPQLRTRTASRRSTSALEASRHCQHGVPDSAGR